jgi:hypothetical protein
VYGHHRGAKVTGLDFMRAGVVFERGDDARMTVKGPEGAAELFESLRFEVELRLGYDLVGGTPKPYCCDTCGDRVGHSESYADAQASGCEDPFCNCPKQHGGHCVLCALARQKQLDLEGKKNGR